MKTNDETNTAPTHTTRAGLIRASVWETTDEKGIRHKITISRLFREENGSWQRGKTFYSSELAAVIEAIGKAQRWIEQRHRQSQTSAPATVAG